MTLLATNQRELDIAIANENILISVRLIRCQWPTMKENGKRHFTAENVCMNKIWKREWPATKEDQRLIALMQYSSEYQSKSKKLANEVKSKRFVIRGAS